MMNGFIIFSFVISGLGLGPITFLAPLTLLGLLALPIIWWLLRVVPPQPKHQTFPPLQILRDVHTEEETPNSTPFWLLVLRLLLVALICIALARPTLTATDNDVSRPMVLVVDTGWDGASNWSTIMREAEARVGQSRRKGEPVALVVTTPKPNTVAAYEDAGDVMRKLKALRPTPLSVISTDVSTQISDLDLSNSDVVWLSSGIDVGGSAAFAENLRTARSVTRLSPDAQTQPLVPGEIEETATGFRTVWYRPGTNGTRTENIQAVGRDGRVIGVEDVTFIPGQNRADTNFELPPELRARVSALRVENAASAGSIKLLDDSWGRPVLGILTSASDSASPLLSEPFYVQAALEPYADIFTGELDEMLSLSPGILMMPDEARSDDEKVRAFVETGGMLIRFAGPKLAARPDTLLPVDLRTGGRALGGALTWEAPQTLAQFSEDSPFFGLKIPSDVIVNRQVMAQPGTETDTRTWARLEDGSPLVTASEFGLGRVVLFHVTADPKWSNLPVSGLYVEMLRRLLSMARTKPTTQIATSGDWAPERILNAFGNLTTPNAQTRPLEDDAFTTTPNSRAHPPGLYQQGMRRKARNTVPNPEIVTAARPIAGVATGLYGKTRQLSVAGILLGLAMILLAVDAVFSLFVSGRLSNVLPRRGVAVMGLCMTCLYAVPSLDAQEISSQSNLSFEDALELRLAYIETGDARLDTMSEAAMEGLVRSLNGRTTIEPDGVRGVNPDTDVLEFYPFIYWPVTRDTPTPTPRATARLNAFMANGGTLVIDTQDFGDRFSDGPNPSLTRVTKNLDVPALEEIPADHVLTKSFYLLQVFPGRWANGPVWVDRDRNGVARDGVSSVIISGNDWAAAWAIDDNNTPMVSVENDILNQREMGIRFGVNVAMYALAGNYKSDQVHSAVLIGRLGQEDMSREDSILREDESIKDALGLGGEDE